MSYRVGDHDTQVNDSYHGRGDPCGRPVRGYIQQTPSVPAGMPWQTSDFATKPSAITVVAMFVLSTATGVSRIDGIAVPSEVFTVTPLVNEEAPVPAISAFARSTVPWASLAIAL